MAAPVTITNLEKVLDCVQYLLENKLNHANRYRTNGTLVIRDSDPRILLQNREQEYREKSCAISIRLGDEEYVEAKSLGDVQRTRQFLQFWCLRSLTKAEDKAGKTIGAVEADLRTDLRWLLRRHSGLKEIAAILDVASPTKGYDCISCMNLLWRGVGAGPIAQFPDTFFVGVAAFEYDEFASSAFQ